MSTQHPAQVSNQSPAFLQRMNSDYPSQTLHGGSAQPPRRSNSGHQSKAPMPVPTAVVEGVETSLLGSSLYAPARYTPANPIGSGPERSFYQAHLAERLVVKPDVRVLAYVIGLATNPKILSDGAHSLNEQFELDEKECALLLKGTSPSSAIPLSWRFDGERALSYRIRCAVLPNPNILPDESAWCVLPCSWPSTIAISTNGRLVELRRRYHWGTDSPANISRLLSPGTNTITVSRLKRSDEKSTWAIAVEIIQLDCEESITARVHAQVETAETTMSRIQEHLNGNSDPDLEILNETLAISVTDPLMSNLIGHPVRTDKCLHLECFDLGTFICSRSGIMAPNNDWRCPVCGADARPPRLTTVLWMKDVVTRLAADKPSTRSILVARDGSWKAKEEELLGQTGDGDESHARGTNAHEAQRPPATVIEID